MGGVQQMRWERFLMVKKSARMVRVHEMATPRLG
jgi:hypothetical protein